MQCTREAVHHTPDGIADAPPQLHNQPNTTQDIQGGRAGTRETTRQRARNSPPSKTGDAQRTSRKPLSSPKSESSLPKLPTQTQRSMARTALATTYLPTHTVRAHHKPCGPRVELVPHTHCTCIQHHGGEGVVGGFTQKCSCGAALPKLPALHGWAVLG